LNTTDCLLRNLQRIPTETAIFDGGTALTWSELCERVGRLAAGFASLGTAQSGRVATLLGNTYRNIETNYAAQWLGAATVPINIRWTAPEVEYALQDCGAKVLVVDKMNWATAAALNPDLLASLQVVWADDGEAPDSSHHYDELIADHKPLPRCECGGRDIASIFYTGGTTGRSKGVLLSHDNHVSHSIALIADCALAAGEVRYLHAAPMFHIADSLFTHVVSQLGGCHVILRQFSPAALAEVVEQQHVNVTVLVPTMIQMVMLEPALADRCFKVLERLFYGASPMPEALTKQMLQRYPELELCQLYGQTEASPVLTILPKRWHGSGDNYLPQARSAGRAMMGTEVRIVDEDGVAVPNGEHGEIVARGPQVMQGYWNREEETAAALRDGWLHTGDAGYMDEQGFVYIVDRIKDMVISGGENVYTIEVEQVLYDLPGVAQCCVVGLPHDKWGEAVHAVVVLAADADLTEAQILEHCRSQLADYKRPRGVTIRQQPLPLSGAGKILKREVRAELSD